MPAKDFQVQFTRVPLRAALSTLIKKLRNGMEGKYANSSVASWAL